jgi:hypothetical protein
MRAKKKELLKINADVENEMQAEENVEDELY